MADDIQRWWEPRRPDESVTADFLGRVLDELGATDLAERARLGHFDDYFAPEEIADGMELIRLAVALEQWGRGTNRVARLRARAVITAIRAGEFDGTVEESERWAASKSGQEALGDPAARAAAEALLEKLKDPEARAAAERAGDALMDRITGGEAA